MSVVVTFAIVFTVAYQLSPYIGLAGKPALLMLLLCPFVVLYLTYMVLKYGKPSRYTFDEKLYEDMND